MRHFLHRQLDWSGWMHSVWRGSYTTSRCSHRALTVFSLKAENVYKKFLFRWRIRRPSYLNKICYCQGTIKLHLLSSFGDPVVPERFHKMKNNTPPLWIYNPRAFWIAFETWQNNVRHVVIGHRLLQPMRCLNSIYYPAKNSALTQLISKQQSFPIC